MTGRGALEEGGGLINRGYWGVCKWSMIFNILKESLHIISVAILYYGINRLSSLKHKLVTVKESLKKKISLRDF